MRNSFAPITLITILAIILIAGGVGVIARRTTYLDPILPSTVREFLGQGGSPTPSESSAETPSETPSEESEPTAEDPTKDWKSYTNSKYGFSFKYPRDWKTSALANGEVLLFGLHAGGSLEAQPRSQLEIYPIGGYGSDYGWDSPGIDYTSEESKWEVNERSVSVNGRSAKRAEHKYKPENLIQVVRIYFSGLSEMRVEFYLLNGNLELFDLILSTFRF